MNKTNIEWVKNPDGSQGYTWNPITGCLNHNNGMCKGGNFPCYAYRLAHGRLRKLYSQLNGNFVPRELEQKARNDPFYPRFWPERLNIRRKYEYGDCRNHIKPRGIFCCDMSDLFGMGIPETWTRHILHEIRENPVDRFYLLTKQPQNLIKFSPFPDNVYLGVTVCNQEMFDRAVYYLKMVDAKVKFLSMEPLLDRICIDL